jgi:hypothetical protein
LTPAQRDELAAAGRRPPRDERGERPVTVPLTEGLLQQVRALTNEALGEEQFAAALARGFSMTTDEAIAEARAVNVPAVDRADSRGATARC